MYQLLIKNATVIDGAGADALSANVGIRDGKIAYIGTEELPADRVLDIHGLALAPGFIDSHSHGDFSIFNPDHPENLEQGITFSVGGHCGDSIAPSRREEQLFTMAQLAEKLQDTPISSQYGILAGHGSIRRLIVGTVNRPVTEEELAKCEAIRRELGSSFCRRCGYCAPCTVGINIPSLFTLVNYLRKYDLSGWAKSRYDATAAAGAMLSVPSEEILPAVCRLAEENKE